MLFPAATGQDDFARAEPWLVRKIKAAYAPVLSWRVDHSGVVIALSVALLAVAVASGPFLGRAFLPDSNEGTLTISAVTIPGTSLAESDELGRALERILLSAPEVVSTARRTGRAELDEHVQGVESAEIDVNLKMQSRSKQKVFEEIREKVTLLPGMNVTIGQPISHRIDHMLSGTRGNIAVKIFGDDLATLRSLAKTAQASMAGTPGAVDLSAEQQTDIPTLRVKVDPVLSARLGLQAGQVTGTEGAQRRIVVQCNVANRDFRSAVTDIQKRVGAAVSLPQGYRIEYGGQFESEASASRRLLLLGLLVIGGILLILTTAFRSFRNALVIMLNLPFALVGGIAGVFLSGGILSVASIIGFITLFGIATRNGIMLVSHVKHLLEEEGETDLRRAILRGAAERISPILMTAMSAGLALVPVALGAGQPGSEIQAPMAMVILSGLFTSTLLNMIVIPSVLGRVGRRGLEAR